MSRSKRRSTQKRREKENQSRLVIRGVVVAIVVIIAGIAFSQLNNPGQETFSEDGRPIWQTMELTDARTGESFTLADFDERDVVVKITSLF